MAAPYRACIRSAHLVLSVRPVGVIDLMNVSSNRPLKERTHGGHNNEHDAECAHDGSTSRQIEHQL